MLKKYTLLVRALWLRPVSIRYLVVSVGLLISTGSVADTVLQLRILATSDIHSHVLAYDYYRDQTLPQLGLARVASLIKDARAEVTNTLLIDNGDLIQGNPLGDYMALQQGLDEGQIHPIYKAMNQMGYDVANIGNHEFNFGLDFLNKAIKGAHFPYVSANVMVDDGDDLTANDQHYFQPYQLLQRQLQDEEGKSYPITIGVIGFVPPQIMQWDKANLQGHVKAEDMLTMAQLLVPEIYAKGADIVIAVPHSGFSQKTAQGMDENVTYYLSQVPGISAIVFGHAHQVFPSATFADIPGVDVDQGTINGVPAVMPGFWGSHLGVIDLQLSLASSGSWQVVGKQAEVRPVSTRINGSLEALAESDKDIEALVQSEHLATIEYMQQPVGKTQTAINSYFAQVADDPALQLVNDAQRWYVKRLLRGTEYDRIPVLSAASPFKSGGRGGAEYYTDIPAGEILRKHLADLYLYPNTLQVVLVSGAQLREWLERSAGQFQQINPTLKLPQQLLNPAFASFNFDVIDGVSYTVDLTQPSRYDLEGKRVSDQHRIVSLQYQGKPVEEERLFAVATNNYRASGGGHFPNLDGSLTLVQSPDSSRDIVGMYIQAHQPLTVQVDHNWQFLPIPESPVLWFETGPKALLVTIPPHTHKVGTSAAGFVVLQMQIPATE